MFSIAEKKPNQTTQQFLLQFVNNIVQYSIQKYL